jgi:hypothetical protein
MEWTGVVDHTMPGTGSCQYKYGTWYYTSIRPMVDNSSTCEAISERNRADIAQHNN